MSLKTKKKRFWVVRTNTKGSQTRIFSNFGGLAGDFCKDTYEAKLFGIHIGSVLSGLEAENVNNDSKKPVLCCKHMH